MLQHRLGELRAGRRVDEHEQRLRIVGSLHLRHLAAVGGSNPVAMSGRSGTRRESPRRVPIA